MTPTQASENLRIKKIGINRVETVVGLMNLTYNMFRKIQLTS
ncbi:MAG: hypothetical protein ACI86M_001806 [Saprospiraceae bacterium]|jgi:hypothetical protein